MGKNRVDRGRGRQSGVVTKGKPANRALYLVLGLVAVAGIGILTFLATRPSQVATAVDPNAPPVTSEGYVLGSPDAPVEVLQFADFECPQCAYFALVTEPDIVNRMINTGEIRMRFIDFPITELHPNAWDAHRAAACAAEQERFWQMHHQIFAAQDRWDARATRNPNRLFKQIARTVPGMDGRRFDECVDSRRTHSIVAAHQAIGQRYGVGGTPTFVIGSQMFPGRMTYDQFRQAVERARAQGDTAPATAPR
jgi:protein-disulfide isomerase